MAATAAFIVARQTDNREDRQKYHDLLVEHRDSLLEIERLRKDLADKDVRIAEHESQVERRVKDAEAATERAIKLYQSARADSVKKKAGLSPPKE